MASEQVLVQVYRDGNLSGDSIRRPVRLTPDGYAGVVFDRAVYPLRRENRIDLGGTSWEPEDAKRFLISGAEIPYAPAVDDSMTTAFAGFSGAWHVETTDFGHYVLFDGPERIAVTLIEELDRAGLVVQRWDVSHRLADNGRQYDWFARLRSLAPHDDIVGLVEAIFATPDPSLTPPLVAPEADRVSQLLERVEHLAAQLAEAQARIAASEAAFEALSARLGSESRRAERLEGLLAKSLHERTIAETAAAASKSPGRGTNADAIELARNEAEELLEFAPAENAELESRVQGLIRSSAGDAERIRSLGEDLSHTNDLLTELGAQERHHARRGSTIPPRGLIAFVQSAFPRLTFVLDSIETLERFEAPQALVRALVEIDKGEMVGEDLEGISGWREVSKIATGVAGSESLGRVYYRPDGQHVYVCVHIKQDDKEQTRLVRRLATLG